MRRTMVESAIACRSCSHGGLQPILDLGPQPDPDCLHDPTDRDPAPEAPIRLVMCRACALVQLSGPRPAGPIPAHGHARSATPDDPWVARIMAALPTDSPVIHDVDGSSGVPPERFPSARTVPPGSTPDRQSDLILVGHALAHVDDLDGLVANIGSALAPRGLALIDAHHVLGLAEGQFDVVSHTHRSYLSLHALERALRRHDLDIVAAECISDFGGTLRVLAARASAGFTRDDAGAARIKERERGARVDRPEGFAGLERQVRSASAEFVGFLDDARRRGRSVAGYGAASRGIAFLNIAGVGADHMSFVVDRAPAKQGRTLPRSGIPVYGVDELKRSAPDDLVILPWPIAPEIVAQLTAAGIGRSRYVVALPKLGYLA